MENRHKMFEALTVAQLKSLMSEGQLAAMPEKAKKADFVAALMGANPDLVPLVIDEKALEDNPELAGEGVELGDVVMVAFEEEGPQDDEPEEDQEGDDEPSQEDEPETQKQDEPEESGVLVKGNLRLDGTLYEAGKRYQVSVDVQDKMREAGVL